MSCPDATRDPHMEGSGVSNPYGFEGPVGLLPLGKMGADMNLRQTGGPCLALSPLDQPAHIDPPMIFLH